MTRARRHTAARPAGRPRRLRADHAPYERHRYAPSEPLDIPVTAFGGATDPGLTDQEL